MLPGESIIRLAFLSIGIKALITSQEIIITKAKEIQ